MRIFTKFDLEQIVYIKLDPEQKPRQVTGMIINPGNILYLITDGIDEVKAYEFELSANRDEVKYLASN
jgi:hypothetical protein